MEEEYYGHKKIDRQKYEDDVYTGNKIYEILLAMHKEKGIDLFNFISLKQWESDKNSIFSTPTYFAINEKQSSISFYREYNKVKFVYTDFELYLAKAEKQKYPVFVIVFYNK